jgi:hypothetical protein
VEEVDAAAHGVKVRAVRFLVVQRTPFAAVFLILEADRDAGGREHVSERRGVEYEMGAAPKADILPAERNGEPWGGGWGVLTHTQEEEKG